LTGGALVLLLSFKTPTDLPAASGTDVAVAAGATPAAVESPATSTAPAAEEPAATASPAPTATAEPGVTGLADGTVVGEAVGIRWGVVQVQVTIADGVITDVTALELPADDHHSAAISQRAEPVLRTAALEAQSAEITVLSGATYTSLAYAESLQSALDAARA